MLFVFLSVYSQCFSGSLYNYRIVKNLEKKIFFFYFTEICVIQTFMVFLFMNKKKIIRFHKIYFYLNINNKFNFTRFFFQNLIVGKSSMTKNTFQSVDVSISEKSILTKHDLINEENSTLFFIRKQDLNMQSLSTGICMFSIALAFFFYI